MIERAKGRQRRKTTFGQAVVETALVLPLLLVLIFNMLGLMIHVRYQQELDAATSLAASAAIAAPYQAQDTATGVAFGQEYATQAFDGTFFGNANGRPANWNTWISTTNPTITCTGDYIDGNGVAAVTCTAQATLNFNQTVLGLGLLVFGSSNLASTATVYPSPVRQCGAPSISNSQC